jgi:HlyD family secretion protein
MKLSRAKADELAKRLTIENERLKIRQDSVEAQLAVERANISKLKAIHELKKSQIQQLKVRAGTTGVLMEMPVQEGQKVPAGTILAKVSEPRRLKAELKVAETQAKDVRIGQYAEVDTRNGIIKGQVMRIDPAPREGTVVVDVKLEGELPQGARPDLSVDGTIEIERVAECVYVGRPAFGQPHSTVSMFKIDPDGKGASRVQVKLGRTSVNTVEVLEGLKVGERVILSDMSTWDAQDRLRIN